MDATDRASGLPVRLAFENKHCETFLTKPPAWLKTLARERRWSLAKCPKLLNKMSLEEHSNHDGVRDYHARKASLTFRASRTRRE